MWIDKQKKWQNYFSLNKFACNAEISKEKKKSDRVCLYSLLQNYSRQIWHSNLSLPILKKLNTYMCTYQIYVPIYLQGPGEVKGLNYV